MSKPAIIRQADLKRMANIAKRENVSITAEIGGRKFTVSPVIANTGESRTADVTNEEFLSLEDWQTWRDNNRAREAQRHP